MATLLGRLLRGSTLAYNRLDCMVMDSSSTALPSPSGSKPTVDGVVLNINDRALYTGLTTANEPNNWVYVLTVSNTSGSAIYSMTPAHDSRSPNQNGAQVINPSGAPLSVGSGSPTALDMLLILEGSTNAGKLMCFDGASWVDTASL